MATHYSRHYYDADEIKALLKHYILKSHPEVDYLCDINALDEGVLQLNLAQELENRVLEESKAEAQKISKLLIPLNLGNAHWVALYLDFSMNQRKPIVHYVDPFGKEPPALVLAALKAVYPGLDVMQHSSRRMQQDGYNCGPWTVAILEALTNTQVLPSASFDITARRQQDALIIAPLLKERASRCTLFAELKQLEQEGRFKVDEKDQIAVNELPFAQAKEGESDEAFARRLQEAEFRAFRR